jgi:hypothetical protein
LFGSYKATEQEQTRSSKLPYSSNSVCDTNHRDNWKKQTYEKLLNVEMLFLTLGSDYPV